MSVIIPTLVAGSTLLDCVLSLEAQTFRSFEVVIVDNSGRGLVRESTAARFGARIIENPRNLGFGAAVNQGFKACRAPFLAVLNDDAMAKPGWLEALWKAAQDRPDVGMWASRIELSEKGCLDSAGMLVCGDGSSRQRGHREPLESYRQAEEVLLPSGCAALYRRSMLEQIGLFDEDFFLYCEDTDLGLRARWAGWKCLYVPEAVVDHRYSLTAGRASELKAYFVERNRLFVMLKNFPLSRHWRGPCYSLARYFWHAFAGVSSKESAAGVFINQGGSLLHLTYLVARAHGSLLAYGWGIWRKRRALRRTAKLSAPEFARLLETHSISPRQVAAL